MKLNIGKILTTPTRIFRRPQPRMQVQDVVRSERVLARRRFLKLTAAAAATPIVGYSAPAQAEVTLPPREVSRIELGDPAERLRQYNAPIPSDVTPPSQHVDLMADVKKAAAISGGLSLLACHYFPIEHPFPNPIMHTMSYAEEVEQAAQSFSRGLAHVLPIGCMVGKLSIWPLLWNAPRSMMIQEGVFNAGVVMAAGVVQTLPHLVMGAAINRAARSVHGIVLPAIRKDHRQWPMRELASGMLAAQFAQQYGALGFISHVSWNLGELAYENWRAVRTLPRHVLRMMRQSHHG